MSSEKYRAGRTTGVTLATLEKRNRCIVALHLSGLTLEEILEAVSNLHGVFRWGNVSSARQVQRILSKHFDGRPMTAKQIMAHTLGLRDAAVNQMEKCVEDIALYAHSVRDSQPSEYFEALKTQAEILALIVKARNFDMSSKDYGKWMGASEHGMEKYRRGIERAGGRHTVTEKLLSSR